MRLATLGGWMCGLALVIGGCTTTTTVKKETPKTATAAASAPAPVKPPPLPPPAAGSVEAETGAAEKSGQRGKMASAFTLPDQDDKPVDLAGLRGKWVVLYFYPKDDTPGCTCQATEFTQTLADFNQLDAVVLGVSPDTTASHRYFRGKYGLEISLLSDADHKVASMYDAWKTMAGKDGAPATGRIVRSTYLIDPRGRIVYHWPMVVPQGHAERIRAKLTELAKPATAAK